LDEEEKVESAPGEFKRQTRADAKKIDSAAKKSSSCSSHLTGKAVTKFFAKIKKTTPKKIQTPEAASATQA